MKTLFTIVALIFFLTGNSQEQVITKWTFDGTIEPSEGEGTASLIGGATQHSVTLASGWRITNFPDQFVGSGTAGASFMVSTEGFQNIQLDYDHRSSGTMSRWAAIEYTVNGGDTWTFLANNGGDLSPHDVAYPFIFDFSGVEGANNNPDFGFRVVSIFSPVEFNPEEPDVTYGANVAYHRARTSGTGGNPYSGEGNWRLLNVTLSGQVITQDGATKLGISSINEGNPVFVGEPFSVTVEARGDDDLPANVDQDTNVVLELATGDGVLSGNLEGTISAGTFLVTISGVIYDSVEEGVSLFANATGLNQATSALFDVLMRTYVLSLKPNVQGAGTLSGGGVFAEDEQVTINATTNAGFVFVKWTDQAGLVVSNDPEVSFPMPASDLTYIANYDLPDNGTLIHYWHFNDLEDGNLTEVSTDFSLVGSGVITYPGLDPGTPDGEMDRRTFNANNPVSNFNLRLGQQPNSGSVLRVRNPSSDNMLRIGAPSTGYENIVVSFATTRTSNGAQEQEFHFSADGGDTWVKVGEKYNIPSIDDNGYVAKTFNLSQYEEANNNPELLFRILFLGDGAENLDGNNRFDNISVHGIPWNTSTIEIFNLGFMKIYPNPASHHFNVEVNDAVKRVQIHNLAGQLVDEVQIVAKTTIIDSHSYKPGAYIVRAVDVQGVILDSRKLVVR